MLAYRFDILPLSLLNRHLKERRELVDASQLMEEESNQRANRVIHFESEEILIDFVLQLIERVDEEFVIAVRLNDTSVEHVIVAFHLQVMIFLYQSIDTIAYVNHLSVDHRTNQVELEHRFDDDESNLFEQFEYYQ